MNPVLSNSFFANAWFSLSILSFSLLLIWIFKDWGPIEYDFDWKRREFESFGLADTVTPPNWESETFFVKLLSLIIFLSRLGANATLICFPHEISTSLFRRIWLCLLIVTFYSILKLKISFKYLIAYRLC